MHTDQILDNLVRLRQGLPFVHLDYIHMTGTITHDATANISGGQTVANKQAAAAERLITTPFGYGAAGAQKNQLTITAEPVTSNPDVYNAYLQFLSVEEHLICTSCPPECGQAIIMKCYETPCDQCTWYGRRKTNTTYYWIPIEYQAEFRNLCLHTVALRGDTGSAISTFDVSVLGLVEIPTCEVDGKPCYTDVTGTLVHVHLKIDKKIPNDKGYIEATVGGHVITAPTKIVISPNTDSELAVPGFPVSKSQKTDVLDIRFDVKELLGLVDPTPGAIEGGLQMILDDLQDQKIKVHLRNFIPAGSQTDTLLEGLRTQLELQRLGQQ